MVHFLIKYRNLYFCFNEKINFSISIVHHQYSMYACKRTGQKYFFIEPGDVEQLSDPQSYIIDKGGYIYFAKYKDKIVGTSSLMKRTFSNF